MKKIRIVLMVAIGVLATASCEKEDLPVHMNEPHGERGYPCQECVSDDVILEAECGFGEEIGG